MIHNLTISIMKRFFYLTILALLPVVAFSQNSDDKYLEGAVNLVDGRVIFDREITVKGLDATQVFNALSEWAALEYTGEGRQLISNDKSVNRITVRGMEKAQVRVGLFPSKININYFLVADCHDGGCSLSFMRFVYTNNPSSDNPNEQIKAEDYITDRYALNKTKTKLVGGTGDYRRQTINLVNSVTEKARAALLSYAADLDNGGNMQSAQTPVQTVSATVVEKTSAGATQHEGHHMANIRPVDKTQFTGFTNTSETEPLTVEGFTVIAPEKIPGNIIKIVEENGIFLTAVNGEKLESEIAGEGGLGVYNGKPALFFNMKEAGTEIPEQTQSLTFTFKNEVFRNATIQMEEWMMIVCIPRVAGGSLVVGEIDQVLIR